jgi:hypothetical protein
MGIGKASRLCGFFSKFNPDMLGIVAHAFNPSYLGGKSRRVETSDPGKVRMKPYLKNKLKAKGLGT